MYTAYFFMWGVMVSTVIPTLGASLFITRPQDKIAYVLRHYASAPKQVSNTNYTQAISLASTLSSYASDRLQIVNPIRQELLAEFTRIFPEASTVDVAVSTTEINAAEYTISISPTVTINDVVYTVTRTLTSSNGVLQITNDTVS